MRKACKKIGFLSLSGLISIGLVACDFDDLFSRDKKAAGASNTSAWATAISGNESTNGSSNAGEDDKTNGITDDTSLENNNTNSGNSNNSGNAGEEENTNSNSSGGSNSVGTAGCVNSPRPTVDQRIKVTNSNAPESERIFIQSTTKAIGNTSLTREVEIISTGNTVVHKDTYVDTFTIANNYLDITKSTVTRTLPSVPNSQTTTVITYNPYDRIAIDRVCEGQTWQSTYTETAGDEVFQQSEIYTIEAVNVPRTTIAGTFNTYRLLEQRNERTVKTWIDIATGAPVFSEETDSSDPSYLEIFELVEIN